MDQETAQRIAAALERIADHFETQPPPQPSLSFDLNAVLMRPINTFELSVRCEKTLTNAGIKRLGALVMMSRGDLWKVKNAGRKMVKEVELLLEGMGLSLGMNIENWPPDAAWDV